VDETEFRDRRPGWDRLLPTKHPLGIAKSDFLGETAWKQFKVGPVVVDDRIIDRPSARRPCIGAHDEAIREVQEQAFPVWIKGSVAQNLILSIRQLRRDIRIRLHDRPDLVRRRYHAGMGPEDPRIRVDLEQGADHGRVGVNMKMDVVLNREGNGIPNRCASSILDRVQMELANPDITPLREPLAKIGRGVGVGVPGRGGDAVAIGAKLRDNQVRRAL